MEGLGAVLESQLPGICQRSAGALLPQITVLTPLNGLHGSGPVSVAGRIGSFHVLHQAVALAMRSQPQICWESCQAWRSVCSDSAGGGQHETAVLQPGCLAGGCRRPLPGFLAHSLWRGRCGWSQRPVFPNSCGCGSLSVNESVAGREEVRCLQPECSALVQWCCREQVDAIRGFQPSC